MTLRTLFTLIAAFFLVPSLFAQNIEWQHALGGPSSDKSYSIQETNDGGYILAGRSESDLNDVWGNNGFTDFWVVKLNSSGDTVWTRCLGGPGNEMAYSVQQTINDGYILAGRSALNGGDVSGNHGSDDFWVVKLNSSGDTVWTRSLGGSNGERAYSVQQTSDGGYILAGRSTSNDGDVSGHHGGSDYWVVKLNASGDTAWTRSLGGSGNDDAYSVKQTSDGGYIVGGEAKSNDGDVWDHHDYNDYWVAKLTNSGDTVWTRSLGGSGFDEGRSIQQTSDGGYIVAGKSNSTDGDVSGNHGNDDYWVVKLNSSGDTAWTRSLGGSGFDEARSVQQTSDGGYIVAGKSNSTDGDVSGNHGNYDFWVVKLNSSGDTIWTRSLGGSDDDYAESIQQTSDNGYVVAGDATSTDEDVSGNHGTNDFWVVKLDGQGTSIREAEKGASLAIRPNPTNGQLRIDLGKNTQAAQITIRDLTGRTVKRQQIENTSTFRTSIEGEPGLYFVELETADGRKEVRKVVKE